MQSDLYSIFTHILLRCPIGIGTIVILSGATTDVIMKYRKTFSIGRTKSRNLNFSWILFQLSSLNPLKPGVQLRMKM